MGDKIDFVMVLIPMLAFFLVTALPIVLFWGIMGESNEVLASNYSDWCQCDAEEQWDMYYESDNWSKHYNATLRGVWGLAHGDFITVWTKDRTITQVLDTCTHEYAHNAYNMTHKW